MKYQQKNCIVCGNSFLDKSPNHTGKCCSLKCKTYFHYHKDIEKSRQRFRDWREKNKEKERKRARDYHRYMYDNNPEYVKRKRENARQFRIKNPVNTINQNYFLVVINWKY